MAILRVQDVDVRMGAHQILRGVTLDVRDTAVVAVIGSNGVGKTSLMRAISGIYRCAAGDITFAGAQIANLKSHRIVRLGLVQAPEGRMIFGAMTVRENLVLGACLGPRRRHGGAVRLCVVAISAARRPPAPEGGIAQRRRAADAVHRPRADGETEAAAARRAVARPGAADGAVDLRSGRPHPRPREPPSFWSSRMRGRH